MEDDRTADMSVERSSRPAQPPVSDLPLPTVADRRATVVELFEAYGDAVLGYCIRLLRDPALAEDVMQQVFLEAFRDFDQFRERSSRRTWLFGIASHRCFDALRNQQRGALRLARDEDDVDHHEAPATAALDRLDRARLLAALDHCLTRLSPELRATVLMRFQTDLTFEQMAVHLGATTQALQMRVSRAMPALRACLERKGWNGE